MASSTSRDSDLKRKLSACNTTDFLRIDRSSDARDHSLPEPAMADVFLRNAYVERSSGPDRGSGSGILMNAEIALLDAPVVVTPVVDGELEPPKAVRKTADDVWREIVEGRKSEKRPKEEMMTLEDFLAKADAAEGKSTARSMEVKGERFSGGIIRYESSSAVIGSGSGMGLDVGSLGRGRGNRSLSLLEPLDKASQQRQKRMIKNRESAARSRERKQAYQVELESMVVALEEEKKQLLKEKAEWMKKRLMQLMENVIPVSEKRRPPRLQRVRSVQ